jgi:hypothetical protein
MVHTVLRLPDKEKRTVSYGWSANVPGRKFLVEDEKTGNIKEVRRKGDMFCKRSGRAIALGRLESKPIVLNLVDDVLPVVAVLEDMVENKNIPKSVAYLADLALNEQIEVFTYGQLKFEQQAAEKAGVNRKAKPTSFLDRMMNWFRV